MDRIELGHYMRVERTKKALSMVELAELSGCQIHKIALMERGVTQKLDVFLLMDVCHVLGIALSDVVAKIEGNE